MPRYVILRHEMPSGSDRPLHWDFMLEAGGVLRTWALAAEPRSDSRVAADTLADHRLHYLDYEGPVSGNRGTVSQWDAGTFEWLRDTGHELVVTLRGRRLVGQVTLVRSTDLPDRWNCSFAAADLETERTET